MKKLFIVCIMTFVVLFPITHIQAEYVLPYPSYMPGNKLYKVSRIIDSLKNYWYWGTIAQIKYHIGLSDKYLVEAKTLFEYKQYLLATNALKRSDKELANLVTLLDKGDQEGKVMDNQQQIILEAMQVHMVTLENMKSQLPSEFLWTPEKATATDLSIGVMLDTSIQIRKNLFHEMQGRKRQFTYSRF